MKRKNIIKALALALMLTLCITALTACKPDPKPDNGGGTQKPTDSSKVSAQQQQDAFFDTLFNSANLIGRGTTVDLSDGKDISLDVGLGLSLSVKKDKQNRQTLPISISIKGFIDRQNIEAAMAEDVGGRYIINPVGDGYVRYSPDTSATYGLDKYKKSGTEYVLAEEGYEGELYVQDFIEFDKDSSSHGNAQKYKKIYSILPSNTTVVDLRIRAQEIDSLRFYYKAAEGRGIAYVTLAGNKFKIDFTKLDQDGNTDPAATDKMEDKLYNAIEGFLKNETLKGIISEFGKEDFDINRLFTSLINQLIGDELKADETLFGIIYYPYAGTKGEAGFTPDAETIYYTTSDGKDFTPVGKGAANPPVGVDLTGAKLYARPTEKLLGLTTMDGLMNMLFKNEANAKKFLSDREKIDVKGILQQASPMLFGFPTFWIDNNQVKDIAGQKSKLYEIDKAAIELGGVIDKDNLSIINTFKDMSFLKGGKIEIGFLKEKGTSAENFGKMKEFYLELGLRDINGSNAMDIKISINKLSFGNKRTDVVMEEINEDEYGPLFFEAGADITLPENLLSVIFRSGMYEESGSATNLDKAYEISLGEGEYAIVWNYIEAGEYTAGFSYDPHIAYFIKGADNSYTAVTNGAVLANGTKLYRRIEQLKVPKTLKLEVKGSIDFTVPANNKAVVTLKGGSDNTLIATIQLVGKDAEIKVEDPKLVPFVMNVVTFMTLDKTAGGFYKYNGDWGWWVDNYTSATEAEAMVSAGNKGSITLDPLVNYYVKEGTTYTLETAQTPDGTELFTVNSNIFIKEQKFALYRGVDAQPEAVLYKKVGENYEVAEANYDGDLYVKITAQYKPADGEPTLEAANFYKPDGTKVNSFNSFTDNADAADALNRFFDTGELKITGINLYNMLFKKSDYSVMVNMKSPEYETTAGAAADAVAPKPKTAGSFELLMNTILKKDKGIISVIDKLLDYKSGELTIGSKNILFEVLDDCLLDYVNLSSDKGGGDWNATIFSAIAAIAEKKTSSGYDFIEAWEKGESLMMELSERGIWINGGDVFIRLDRTEPTAAETLLAEWKIPATTAAKRTEIEGKLRGIGYVLIRTTADTSAAPDAVLYPSVHYKYVSEYATLWETRAKLTSPTAEQTAELNAIAVELTKLGFGIELESNKYKLTSKSIAQLKADYLAKLNASAAAVPNLDADVQKAAKLLFRRGVAVRAVKQADGWIVEEHKVFFDEAILSGMDAVIKIITEKDGDRITQAKVNVGLSYNGKEALISLWFKPMSDALTTNGSYDAAKIVINSSLLTEGSYGTLDITLMNNACA